MKKYTKSTVKVYSKNGDHAWKRLPTKIEGVSKFEAIVDFQHLPDNFPTRTGPNLRTTDDLEALEYKETGNPYNEVYQSITTPNERQLALFSTKSLGINIFAHSTRKLSDDVYEIWFDKNSQLHGVSNGAHLYAGVLKHRQADDGSFRDGDVQLHINVIGDALSEDEVRVCAHAQNTAMQVKNLSLYNDKGYFDAIKDVLKDTLSINQVKYCETDQGTIVSAEHLINALWLFNTNKNVKHNKQAVTSTAKGLKAFKDAIETNDNTFDRIIPLLPDILELEEIITMEGSNMLLEKIEIEGTLSGSAFKGAERKKAKPHPYGLTSIESRRALAKNIVFPILAGFRRLVDFSENEAKWVHGFETIKKVWNESKEACIDNLYETLTEDSYDPALLAKQNSYWNEQFERIEGTAYRLKVLK